MSGLPLDDLKLFAESLSLDDLKLIAKSRGIKCYKNMSKKRLLSSLSKPKIDQEKLKNIIEDLNNLRHKFSTQKIKEIEKSFSGLMKYLDYDAEYTVLRDVRNLFDQSTDKDYYKSVKTKSAFNGNYIEYERNGDKDKNLSEKKYLYKIRLY